MFNKIQKLKGGSGEIWASKKGLMLECIRSDIAETPLGPKLTSTRDL